MKVSDTFNKYLNILFPKLSNNIQGSVRLGGARLAAHSASLDTALQTGLVTSHPGQHLQLHSPTR